MINPLETLETWKIFFFFFFSKSQMWLRGGRKGRPRVSSPYATAGKLARLQCFPCRDLEVFFQIFSVSNVATRGRKGAKHRSTRTRRSRRTASHGFFSPMSTYTPPRGFYGGEEGQPTTTLVPMLPRKKWPSSSLSPQFSKSQM